MIKPLKYHSSLTLEEAKERYVEVLKEFEIVKKHYSGLFSRFKKNMSEEDKKALNAYMGVLLPLSLEKSVIEERGQIDIWDEKEFGVVQKLLGYKISQLEIQILDYLANFKNTGVTRLEGSEEDLFI